MYQEMVKEFHESFGINSNDVPNIISKENALRRIRLMMEELAELTKAMQEENLIEISDGIADLLYVTFGAAVEYGLPMDKIFQEVHRSNMTKVDGHMENGKWIKPDNYEPPKIKAILDNYRKEF